MTLSIRYFILLTASALFCQTAGLAQKKSQSKKPVQARLPTAQPRMPTGPGRLHFCGEVVPTQQGDVSSKLAFALASSSGYARHVNGLKARSTPYFAVIEPILAKHGIPNDLKYLPLIESAWNANAVSSAGAVGYWQFMDDTAQDMGLHISPGNDERTDLRKSTEAACKYLKFLYRKLGSWTLVAAAYNGGIGMVERKIIRTGHRDYYSMTMNAETGHYLYRILAMKELFTNPAYGLGSVGMMLASNAQGNAYEAEREQARRMGWLNDSEPELVGTPVQSEPDFGGLSSQNNSVLVDSMLTEILRNQPAGTAVFAGDVSAKLLRAGLSKRGQSWAFTLTEDVQIGEDELHAGDVLYALVDDVDERGTLFLRATKIISAETKTAVPLTLMAINPATGLAGIPKPKTIKPGWVVQWKL